MRTAARTDANHAEIRNALRRVGCHVIDTFQLPNTFDMLVAKAGVLYCVEVKNPEQPHSKRKLTAGERKCAEELSKVGVNYWVIETVEEAFGMLGMHDMEPAPF